MEYSDAAQLLNEHLFDGDKIRLLEKVADSPERYVGLFRPTRPRAKMIQNLTQSHEIRFGDAMEKLHDAVLADNGYTNLSKVLKTFDGETLNLDLYFTDDTVYYFGEQKVRDDHDSTKKRGQIENFEKKLKILIEQKGDNLVGFMHFIDPHLNKNKNYYRSEIGKFKQIYTEKIHLFYGREFFDFLGRSDLWDKMINWLTQWKDDLAEFPEINMDKDPQDSFEEIKTLKGICWVKILSNDQLWDEGIIRVLFSSGKTLKLMLNYYNNKSGRHCKKIRNLLKKRFEEYYKIYE